METLISLYVAPIIASFEQYLWHSFALVISYLVLTYFINVVILQTSLYQFNTRDVVDEDLRSRSLGWMFALAASFFILTLNIGYIYFKGSYEHPVDLSAHWTTATALLVVWILVRWNFSRAIRALSVSGLKAMR